jgi:hypothetical protein
MLNVAGTFDNTKSIVRTFTGGIKDGALVRPGIFVKTDGGELAVADGFDKFIGVAVASNSNLGENCDTGTTNEFLVTGDVVE